MTGCITVLPLAAPSISVSEINCENLGLTTLPLSGPSISVSELDCAPLGVTVVTLIPGPSGGGGGGFSAPQNYTVTVPGDQTFVVGSANALLFCNGLMISSAEYSIVAGVLTTDLSYPVMVGDIFTFIPF